MIEIPTFSCELAMKPLNIITSFDAKVKRAQSNEHKADRGAMISDFTLILQIQRANGALLIILYLKVSMKKGWYVTCSNEKVIYEKGLLKLFKLNLGSNGTEKSIYYLYYSILY